MNRLPTLSRFNSETMSGIFPGTRPKHVRQMLIHSLAPSGEANEHPGAGWAQLRWYEAVAQPASGSTDGPLTNEPIKEKKPATLALFLGAAAGEWQDEPLIALSWPAAEREGAAMVNSALVDALNERLAAAGWRLRTCATCAHWWPDNHWWPDEESGCCTWRAASGGDDSLVTAPDSRVDGLVEPLTAQGPLALACAHWQSATGRESTARPIPASPTDRPQHRVRWQRLLPRLANRRVADKQVDWHAQVMERLSGPGSISAGTEPCAVCPGRSVNLGARSGESAEGDAETGSVWRCNRCHTFYANQWVDRWVRLDSLETEETVVRIAPSEAFALLEQIVEQTGNVGWTSAFRRLFASRPPLSHQIKHGR